VVSLGVVIDIDEAAGQRLARTLRKFEPPYDELMENIAALVESQTRRRIQEEKTSPDGEPWPEWSEDYAESKHGADRAHWDIIPHGTASPQGGHSYLQLDGGLLDSITSEATADEAIVGSNLVYAAAQHFGGDGIRPRPYLGLSSDNEAEIVELIEDWFTPE